MMKGGTVPFWSLCCFGLRVPQPTLEPRGLRRSKPKTPTWAETLEAHITQRAEALEAQTTQRAEALEAQNTHAG
jgi:hypothetical protein